MLKKGFFQDVVNCASVPVRFCSGYKMLLNKTFVSKFAMLRDIMK